MNLQQPEPAWLAQTKLSPPLPRPKTLPRPRLAAALDDALARHRLTLLSAPAGYGKTTLLTEWASGRLAPLSLAWLSLDEEDNDPAHFLTALAMTCDRLIPGLGANAMAMLPSLPRKGVRPIVAALINDLATAPSTSVLLALDNLHQVTEPLVYVALNYLLERAPSSLRLVVSTRHDPPLSLARLRSRDQLAELRLADLRFTPEEMAAFFNDLRGLRLSSDEIALIQQLSEGWPAGLQLLASSLASLPQEGQRSRFFDDLLGAGRYIFDFLAEEVLQRQKPANRAFLLETSILSELTGERCRVVTGRADAALLLQDLYRRDLFLIALDAARGAFRYHPLFAHFLRQQLTRELPEQLPELHRRAAETQPFLLRAMPHYLAAGLWEEAAGRIVAQGPEALKQGLLATLTTWIQRLPEETRQRHPGLIHLQGVCAWQRGDPLAATDYLEDALRRFEAAGDKAGQIRVLTDLVPPLVMSARYDRVHQVSKHALAHALGPTSRVQILMVQGIAEVTEDDWRPAKAHLQEALAITEQANDPETWAAQMIHCLSQFAILPGAIDGVERICAEATRRFAGQASPANMAAAARYALVHLLRGRLASCVESAGQALALGRELGGIPYLEGEAAWSLAQAQLAASDYPAALGALKLARGFFLAFPHGAAAVSLLYYLWGMAVYHQGRVAELRHYLMQMETFSAPGQWAAAAALRDLLAGVTAIAEGREQEAERILAAAARFQEETPTSTRFGSGRLLLAHLYQRQGRSQAALAEFTSLMDQCQRQGLPGRLLLEGEIAVPLLRLALAHDVQPALAAHLLDILGGEFPAPGHRPEADASPMEAWEALTPQELVVLRLLAGGARNHDIAEALVISEGTVKTHVYRIFRKLGVASRTEAAARARALRLL